MLKFVYNNEVEDISKRAHDYAIDKFSLEKLDPIYKEYYRRQ